MNLQSRSWKTNKAKASKELSRAKYYKEYHWQRELWNNQQNINISISHLCFNEMQTKDNKQLLQVNDTWTSRVE